jgi:hypothetical protein
MELMLDGIAMFSLWPAYHHPLSLFFKKCFFSWPTDLIKEYMHEEKALSLFV